MKISSVSTKEDLVQIVKLQSQNLKRNLTDEQIVSDGFVSVEHTLELLEKMNTPHPHTVATDNGNVVGYVLSMTKDKRDDIPMLQEMIDMINLTEYDGVLLRDHNYVIVGQVCIGSGHRGKGVFSEIYEYHKNYMKDHFDYLITGVSTSNQRSLKAHKKIGFQVLNIFRDSEGEWANIICKLK